MTTFVSASTIHIDQDILEEKNHGTFENIF